MRPNRNVAGMNPKTKRLYAAWVGMRWRCNPKYRDHHCYYDRCIHPCSSWNDFEVFAKDMGPHPGKGWWLDRKDNDGNYTKLNCRWATPKMQQRNRSNNKLTMDDVVEIRRRYIRGTGRVHRGNSKALAKEFGVHWSMISYVVRGEHWA
jgi:hypothetical protein